MTVNLIIWFVFQSVLVGTFKKLKECFISFNIVQKTHSKKKNDLPTLFLSACNANVTFFFALVKDIIAQSYCTFGSGAFIRHNAHTLSLPHGFPYAKQNCFKKSEKIWRYNNWPHVIARWSSLNFPWGYHFRNFMMANTLQLIDFIFIFLLCRQLTR